MIPCAIYTRKSSEEGLEQGFNSLDAQREACEAFIVSQKAQGWKAASLYDDGGFSGGNVDRPGLQRLLADFAKLVELFDTHGVSFVSVTQQFNTTSSMGRLTLNVLLSFAQFEREVTGERIRDKIAASKRKGMWMGGFAPVGYVPHERTLKIDEPRAARVREIYRLYLELGCVRKLKIKIDALGWKTPVREGERPGGNKPFSRGHLYRLLSNPIYIGRIPHKGNVYPGQHEPIIELEQWQAVQERITQNAQVYSERSNAAEPAPLAGLLVDEQGRRFSPTHTNKKGTRYRYYVRAEDGADPAARIPAPEIEGALANALRQLLGDRAKLLELTPKGTAAQVQQRLAAAAEMATLLSKGTTHDRLRIITKLISQIVVHPDALSINVKLASIWPHEGMGTELYELLVPAKLKRCGLAVKLIVPGANDTRSREPDAKLVALLAKARRWFEALRTGAYPSIFSIAQEQGVESKEVTRIVYLAFLAPGIVEMIATGAQPIGLGVRRLLAMAPLPLDWAEQRKLLNAA